MTLGTRQEQVPVEHFPRPRVTSAEPTPGQPTPGQPVPDQRTPREDAVQRSTRALLVAFVVFTMLAVNQLLVLGGDTERFFAWPIASRPASAFLGAAYAAGTVLSVLALRQARWSHVRVPVLTVTAFTALTLVPTLLHRHRLNLMEHGTARAAAVVWIVIYIAVPVAGAVVVLRQWRARRLGSKAIRRPMPALLVAVLLAQGAVLVTIGAVLYAWGFRSHMTIAMPQPGWPWPITPLTSQVTGAWLLSFGIAIALAIRERDLSRMFVPAVAYAVFGVVEIAVLLYHRGATGTNPLWLWADLALFATLVPVGLYGARAAGRREPSAAIER